MYSSTKLKFLVNEYTGIEMFRAILIIKNGLSAYADTDYEYMHTDEAPTEEQIAEFKRNMCRKYLHIRHTQVFVEQITEEQQIQTQIQ